MKRLFLAIMFRMAVEGNGGNGGTPVEPTSEKLDALMAELAELADVPEQHTKLSKEWHDANMAIGKKYVEIEAEKANIRKAEAAAKLAEARNAKLALIGAFKDAIGTDGEQAAYDALANELLSKSATPAKKAADTDGTAKPAGERGATSKRIRERFIANRAAGMSDTDNVKEIIASGESRGTTGAVVLAYQREIGEKE